MLKALIKKQFTEIFRIYFYNPKTNKARSKGGTTGLIILFAALMLYLAGSVTAGCFLFCKPLVESGCGWLYFALTSVVAVTLGAFGSIFSTYTGLYLSKDNDLLLSMPIPVGKIITARLVGVYLMGLLYSSIVALPASIVYLIVAEFSVGALVGALLSVVLISVLVLVLCCALGYVVARISVKLKNKSFITVIISLVLFALYYVLVFRFQDMITGLINLVSERGAALKNDFYVVYMIGSVGEGNWLAMLVSTAVHALLAALTVWIISRSFIRIANNSQVVARVKDKAVKVKKRSVFRALVAKEGKRFTSSSSYMLNCGIGLFFMPALAVVAFVFKDKLLYLEEIIGIGGGKIPCAIAALSMSLILSMIVIDVPSVSLEGKSLWILKSLPIDPLTAIKAKLAFHIIITAPVVFVVSACLGIAVAQTPLQIVALVLLPQAVLLFDALLGLILGVKMANVNWTNEIVPIKQSLSMFLAPLFGWLLCTAISVPYIILIGFFAFEYYALIATAVVALASFGLWSYLKRGGVEAFEKL